MWLGIELTHHCNLHHPMCDHRVHSSDYEMSWRDFQYVLSHLGAGDDVILVGGEPTLWPRFEDATRALLDVVDTVQVKTNGAHLDRLPEQVLARLDVTLQEYLGENDKVVERFRGHHAVTIRPFKGWWDPNRDPNLTDERAKAARANCGISSGGLRVYGRRLYSCCLSEAIERHWHTPVVHVPFDARWREWERIPTWHACKHCFRVIDWGL